MSGTAHAQCAEGLHFSAFHFQRFSKIAITHLVQVFSVLVLTMVINSNASVIAKAVKCSQLCSPVWVHMHSRIIIVVVFST